MDSANDDQQITQHDLIPEPQAQQEFPSNRKGCLYFSAIVFALLFLFIKQRCISSYPDSFKEWIRVIPVLVNLTVVFPVGLAPLLDILFSKEVARGAALPIGWAIYVIHGFAMMLAQNRKTIYTLLLILVVLLLINVYGCVTMLNELSHI